MELADRLAELTPRIVTLQSKLSGYIESAKQCKVQAQNLAEQESFLAEELALAKLCVTAEADSITYIESIVTALLQTFFDSDIEFHIRKVMDGDVLTGLSPCYYINGAEKRIGAEGGGCRNLTTLGIRMALLALASVRHGLELTMVMDEQLLNLDPDNWDKLVDFQAKIAEMLNMQFICILHTPVEFPTMVRFTPSGGSTKITTRTTNMVLSNSESRTGKKEA